MYIEGQCRVRKYKQQNRILGRMDLLALGKYELRPAVKKLYQLRPKVSRFTCYQLRPELSTPKHDELRPAVSKELHQLRRKIRVYKISNNWKVLNTVLLYFAL
jgi:hypothetical protein